MASFKLIVALAVIIDVVQLSTSSPISAGNETDVTKMFTPEELIQARNAGIRDRELINGKTRGVSVDEMVKIVLLAKTEVLNYDQSNNETTRPTTFDEMARVCEILAPQLKAATDASSDQQHRLNLLMESVDVFPRDIQFLYLRNSMCAYLSEPSVLDADADSFDMKFIPYMKFRFWKLKNQNASGVERVNTAKELCCFYKGRDNVSQFKVESSAFSSSNEKMSNFASHWNEYETTNTSKSFEKLCDFLSATDPSDGC